MFERRVSAYLTQFAYSSLTLLYHDSSLCLFVSLSLGQTGNSGETDYQVRAFWSNTNTSTCDEQAHAVVNLAYATNTEGVKFGVVYTLQRYLGFSQSWANGASSPLRSYHCPNGIANASNAHTFTIGQSGTYRVKADIYTTNACGVFTQTGWTLHKVDYTPDRVFHVNWSARATGTIEGKLPDLTQPNRLCSANPIELTNTSSGTGGGNNTFGYQHRIVIKKVTPAGGGIFMTQAIGYDSGWQNGNPPTFNLINLTGVNGNYLDNNSGHFLVDLMVKNNCTPLPFSALGDGFTSFWLELVPEPDPIAVSFVVNKSQPGNLSTCYSQALPGCPTGRGSATITVASSGPIDEYDLEIIEVDCNTGQQIGTEKLHNKTYGTQSNSGTLPASISLNGLNIKGQTVYFADAARVGECFKLTVRIRNICETIERWSYFQIEDGYLIQPGPGEDGLPVPGNSALAAQETVYPNPTTGDLTLHFNQAITVPVQVQVCNSLGQVLLQRRVVPHGTLTQLSLPTAQLPAGLYWLRLSGPEAKQLTFRKQ